VEADPRPAQLPLPGGSPGATVRLHPLLCGDFHGPASFLAAPKSRLGRARVGLAALGSRKNWLWIPVPAFLVEHPTAGPLLIDAGLHPDAGVDWRKEMGRFSEVRMEPEQAVRTQLVARGVEPNDISHVVMTHLHTDHASGVREFPDATFLVTRDEWDAAVKGGATKGYERHHFDEDFDWRLLDYAGADSYATFGRSIDLFGDGSVRVVSTPGHSLGHQSVVLRLREREALLVGDAAYDRETIADRSREPFIQRDRHLFRRSAQEVRLFARENPGALVVPGHDAQFWPTLAALYD
jgi:N-acyl homoserine lactone hydrolase